MHRHGPLTRAVATERAGLARSAAGQAAEQLQAAGLIRSGEQHTAGMGRPSVVLAHDPSGPLALAVKVEPTGVQVAAYALGLHRQGRVAMRAMKVRGASPQRLCAAIGELADQALGGAWERCAGVGIAFPGMVDPDAGVVQFSLVVDWSEPVELVARLRAVLPEVAAGSRRLPIALVRDSTATALGRLPRVVRRRGRPADRARPRGPARPEGRRP